MSTMKNTTVAGLLLLVMQLGLYGCASNGDIESSVAAASDEASQALNAANNASSSADRASAEAEDAARSAANAQATADEAKALAEELSDKIDRMFKKAMLK